MRRHRRTSLFLALGALVFADIARAEVFAYPKQGQSQQQFEQDQFQCHQWAKGQTGVDPTRAYAAPSQAPPQRQGGAMRGAARGAALGAIGGAIGGDAGKGAAIGAAVGGAGGAMRQQQSNRASSEQVHQMQAQQQQALQRYERAYAACLEGRGYHVR